MKILTLNFLLPVILIATSALASASPEYQESTSESLIGSGLEGYAVRRIESNNQGSYYASEEKTYLDEYDKVTSKLIKSTLLIDKSIVIDAAHNDPNTRPKVTTTIRHKDKTLQLADIYEKYPPLRGSWQPDWLKEFAYTDNGVVFKKNLVVSTYVIDKLYKISFNHDKAVPKILSVKYNGDSIFLKITTRRSEDGISNKIICLSPRKTRQVYAWAYIQPIYLKISSHDTLAKANLEALNIQQSLREKEKKAYPRMLFEIWSLRLRSNKMAYYVVLKNSTHIINSHHVERWSGILAKPLIPIPSKGLSERWTPHKNLIEENQ